MFHLVATYYVFSQTHEDNQGVILASPEKRAQREESGVHQRAQKGKFIDNYNTYCVLPLLDMLFFY